MNKTVKVHVDRLLERHFENPSSARARIAEARECNSSSSGPLGMKAEEEDAADRARHARNHGGNPDDYET